MILRTCITIGDIGNNSLEVCTYIFTSSEYYNFCHLYLFMWFWILATERVIISTLTANLVWLWLTLTDKILL